MAALSVFFMQSPSFLAHQRALAEGRRRSNAHTLFGLDRIPCDNHIRQLLDGVPTEHFDGQFHAIVGDLDGTHAPPGRPRAGRPGRHGVLSARTARRASAPTAAPSTSTRCSPPVVAPGQSRALPLPPEFVQPQDGAAKQDCERQAVKRWLQRHGGNCAALRPVYLGDDLYACQPVCQAMLDAGGDFLSTSTSTASARPAAAPSPARAPADASTATAG